MPSGSFILQPLRGYAPHGELDVLYDLMRASMTIEIPFWEGCDRPFLRQISTQRAGGKWIRPEPIEYEPKWNTDPSLPVLAGYPKSGHIANSIHATRDTGVGPGAGGWQYANCFFPAISPYFQYTDYSILIVGTPLCYMNPELTGDLRGNSHRFLWTHIRDNLTADQNVRLNYAANEIAWTQGAITANRPVTMDYYGSRMAFLFVSGNEHGVAENPRCFLSREDGQFERVDFPGLPPGYLISLLRHLELFTRTGSAKNMYTAGGCWEYYALFLRAFSEDQGCTICRDAVGAVKWDPYVVRRIGWQPELLHQLSAAPGVFGRVSAKPSGWPVVGAEPSNYPRVSASARGTGARIAAEPTTYQRISARVRIADKEADVQATPLCPSEMNWMADNVLELADVLDEMQVPPAEITSADSVTVEIWDRDTDTELTVVSPVTLSQVGVTNAWRESVLVNAANGFAELQRLLLIFIFDGGVGLTGRFYALAVVAQATS